MRIEKPYLAFIFFILVNIGQTAAQTSDVQVPDVQEHEAQAPDVQAHLAEKTIRSIGTGLGYSFIGYRDETDLPLNRYMDTLNFNINTIIEQNDFYYLFNFGFLTGETDPLEINNNDKFFTYNQIESVFFRLYLENALDYRLWGNRIFPGYLGGAIRGDFYYSVLQQSNYYSLTALCSLDIHITQKWIISEGKKFIFSASIPVFGFAFRPPYYGLLYAPLDSEQRITSFHNYIAVFGDLKYHHQINRLFSFYLGLGFELSLITFPQPRNDASLCLNAGITFSF
jgi:hypothetical protein